MIRRFFRFLTIPSLLIGLTTSTAHAQFVVHDPVNGVILIDQKLNQLTQIKNQVQQLQYQLQNLKPYSTDWSGLLNQVEALRAQIAANAPTIVNANAQLAQMHNEIATLQQLQAMSNGAQGSMQVAQTTNSLIATVVGQMQKQRALTINAIQEEERNKAAAYAALYGPSQMSK
jgi:conjugal transfer/entry exclusion protein